ncbi:MAG: hypothetical protein SFY32_11150 [Bacteroidota bacterium]|nr:hypothetical protein [Bacteroidota bacterium]
MKSFTQGLVFLLLISIFASANAYALSIFKDNFKSKISVTDSKKKNNTFKIEAFKVEATVVHSVVLLFSTFLSQIINIFHFFNWTVEIPDLLVSHSKILHILFSSIVPANAP